jgi:hypothetical protein
MDKRYLISYNLKTPVGQNQKTRKRKRRRVHQSLHQDVRENQVEEVRVEVFLRNNV